MERIIEKRLKRSEVPEHLTWDLRDLFLSDELWEEQLIEIEASLPSFENMIGKVTSSANNLLQCLLNREQLNLKLVKVSAYATLKLSEDGSNPLNQSNSSKLSALLAKVNSSLSFIDSELLQLDQIQLDTYIKEEPGLEPFKQNIGDLLLTKPFRLAPETEQALAALGEVHSSPYFIYQTSKSADMDFPDFVDDEGNSLPNSFALFEDRYEFSANTTVRHRAYESFIQTLKRYQNTYAAIYSTEVKKQVTLARLRGYESVTNMLLQSQKVEPIMYENQLNIIQTRLSPHMKRFARLKRQILGLDKLKFCDLKAPLDPTFNPKTTYEEASKTILEALRVMGPEYSAIMQKALTERWIDLSENVGKSTGAFCSSPYGSHPYILITWTNTMRGAFVLAHELGHAGHFYLANQHQRIMGTRPSMYFIEAPSTMNEMLLGDYLLSQTNDPQMKRWVILQLLGTYYHNFVTHLLEAEFQRRVYHQAENGIALTASQLNQTKRDVLTEFWGDEVEIDEGAALTWMRQPHYYMGLYPYTYSAGLTASTAVSQLIKTEGKPVVDRWIEVLKAGGTMTPIELLKYAGIDMTTSKPIESAVAYVGQLIDELEESYRI